MASIILGHRVTSETLKTIHLEIDNAELIVAKPEDIIKDHKEGFVSTATASRIRGYSADEAEKAEQFALRLTGRSTKPLLRVPYGERDARVLSVLEEHGYRSVYWDVDSWDSYKKGITSGEIEQRVLSRVGNGSIVLMHCGSRATTNALDSILKKLTAAGYEPVTVGELLR